MTSNLGKHPQYLLEFLLVLKYLSWLNIFIFIFCLHFAHLFPQTFATVWLMNDCYPDYRFFLQLFSRICLRKVLLLSKEHDNYYRNKVGYNQMILWHFNACIVLEFWMSQHIRFKPIFYARTCTFLGKSRRIEDHNWWFHFFSIWHFLNFCWEF